MGTACARPEPPSPAEAAVVPGHDKGFALSGLRAFEIELEGAWVPFEPRVSALIAEAEAQGRQRVEYQARRQNYVVDLQAMEQVNTLSGTRRRLRRAGAGALESSARGGLGVGLAAAMAAGGLAGGLRAPPLPEAFPELLQLGEPELSRLKGSRAALDAFVLQLPPAGALVERAAEVREENGRLRKSAAADLALAAQRADTAAEAFLQDALEAPGSLDLAALQGFRERFLQQKAEKHKGLVSKRRLECSDAEWHALCLAPAATRGGR